MPLTIAIQPDDYTAVPDKPDCASPRWADTIEAAGHRVKWVDVFRADILEQLADCDGLMWRWAHFDDMARVAKRLLPVLERHMGLPVYPDQASCWHYDDKIAQHYIFQATGLPTPKTWVWFDRRAALAWLEQHQSFPLVVKLSAGAGSSNVRLAHDREQARWLVERMFRAGMQQMTGRGGPRLSWGQRIRCAIDALVHGDPVEGLAWPQVQRQGRYALFQEFLPGNGFDTRVTVIGNRAFPYRRMNRRDDFRASGSGIADWDQGPIDTAFVDLAYRAAHALGSSSCAIDGLYREGQHVLTEVSYTYVSWMVHDVPGHWELTGPPGSGQRRWVDGHMWPEQAQAEDFLRRVERHATARRRAA